MRNGVLKAVINRKADVNVIDHRLMVQGDLALPDDVGGCYCYCAYLLTRD